jgi:hypothetical protein
MEHDRMKKQLRWMTAIEVLIYVAVLATAALFFYTHLY